LNGWSKIMNDPIVVPARTLSRRAVLQSAAITAGAAAMIERVSAVTAQGTPEASPLASPAVGTFTKSITRDEYFLLRAEKFPTVLPTTPGGQIIEGAAGDVSTLNPNLANDNFSLVLCMWIFNALVKTSVVDGSIVPDLADYWETSEDGLTYIFHLNKDAAFHDGTPLTSADVVFTYDALLDESSLGIKTSELRQSIKSYRAIDDHTFELVALEPSPIFLLKTVDMLYIMPKHLWENIPPADWATSPGSTGQDPALVVGSGPFKFSEWAIGDHSSMIRNEAYWLPDEIPYIETFTQRVSPEPSAAAQALISGELDILGLDTSQYGIISPLSADFNVVTWDSMAMLALWPNQDAARTPLFIDTRVRQAMLYAIDRQLVAEQIFFGLAVQADGTQHSLSNAYAPDEVNTIYSYDPEKATALLEEAGWVDADGDGIREKDGVKFSFEYLYYQDDQLVPYFQESWAAVGLELVASKVPFDSLLDSFFSGQFDIVQVSWGWTNPDGDQGTLYRTDAWYPNGNNMMKYSNPEYDALNDAQLVELDTEARRQLLIDQSNILNDDVAQLILLFLKLSAASQLTVRNYFPNGYLSFWGTNKLWIDAA
jgi:peptide/nickel transport system substrate-binding protein